MRKRQREEILISFFKEKEKYEELAEYRQTGGAGRIEIRSKMEKRTFKVVGLLWTARKRRQATGILTVYPKFPDLLWSFESVSNLIRRLRCYPI